MCEATRGCDVETTGQTLVRERWVGRQIVGDSAEFCEGCGEVLAVDPR